MPFVISTCGAATPQPHDLQHVPRPLVGHSLAGNPIYQGFASQVWVYKILTTEKMAALLNGYFPENPLVQITYLDPALGSYLTKWARMHEPLIGSRHTFVFENVTVQFTHLADDPAI